MKRSFILAVVILAGALTQGRAADINFGEVRTRFEIQKELTATHRLRPVEPALERPWEADWRHTYAWQHGRSLRAEFAAPGCTIARRVTTPSGTRLRELFIC